MTGATGLDKAGAPNSTQLARGQRVSALLAQMTLAQKLQMVVGTGFAFNAGYAGPIQGIPSLGIPDIYLADGAMGVGNGNHQNRLAGRLEVAQLYLTDPAAAGEPPFQLKGFAKVTLAPGHSQRIHFELSRQDLSYYQTASSGWAVAPGQYRVSIGSNERDLAVSGSFFAS